VGFVSHRHDKFVELTRVPPFEAEVIAARLRAEGIAATTGAGSVYVSISVADGVPVFVPAEDEARAREILEDEDSATDPQGEP
jgi:hypothetical protein